MDSISLVNQLAGFPALRRNNGGVAEDGSANLVIALPTLLLLLGLLPPLGDLSSSQKVHHASISETDSLPCSKFLKTVQTNLAKWQSNQLKA